MTEQAALPDWGNLAEAHRNTLVARMGITITEASASRVTGTMPVAGNNQPYGLLHGGASCVLAETLGSVGSVLQSGEQFFTLVPVDAPLEIEANVLGQDNGFVHTGDPVSIKFDSFPYIQYGMAEGTVRTISPDSFQ